MDQVHHEIIRIMDPSLIPTEPLMIQFLASSFLKNNGEYGDCISLKKAPAVMVILISTGVLMRILNLFRVLE